MKSSAGTGLNWTEIICTIHPPLPPTPSYSNTSPYLHLPPTPQRRVIESEENNTVPVMYFKIKPVRLDMTDVRKDKAWVCLWQTVYQNIILGHADCCVCHDNMGSNRKRNRKQRQQSLTAMFFKPLSLLSWSRVLQFSRNQSPVFSPPWRAASPLQALSCSASTTVRGISIASLRQRQLSRSQLATETQRI